MSYMLELTNSERMALIDVLIEAMRGDHRIEVYFDMSTSPPTETTPQHLLALVTSAPMRDAATWPKTRTKRRNRRASPRNQTPSRRTRARSGA